MAGRLTSPALLAAALAASLDLPGAGAQGFSGIGVEADKAIVLAEDAAGVLAADLDGDGIEEWVAALSPAGILVRPGDGSPSFILPGLQARALAAREAKGGGAAELILALEGAVASVDITTGAAVILGALDAAAVAAGDLDGDGLGDVLAAVMGAGVLLLGEGVEEDLVVSDVGPTRLGAGDFLGRGYDQAAFFLPEGAVQVLDLVAGDSTLIDVPPLGPLGALDLDGDGAAEIVSYLPDQGLIAIHVGAGTLSFIEPGPDAAASLDGFLRIDLAGAPSPSFVRGNVNADAEVDISDAVAILGDLFLGVPVRETCQKALDANDSGEVDIADPVYILVFLFGGGPAIPPPYPDPGTDPTPDALECVR